MPHANFIFILYRSLLIGFSESFLIGGSKIRPDSYQKFVSMIKFLFYEKLVHHYEPLVMSHFIVDRSNLSRRHPEHI